MHPALFQRRNSLARRACAFLLFFFCAPFAHASTGIITSPDQYAWGNVAGWINFATASSTITVSDSSLTGYAWSANDGWINLSPAGGGVTNSDGALGGWAWDESAGWVSFSGVSIDASGTFHGEATGADGYAINFSCTTCDVQTSWRRTTIANNTANNNTNSPGAISPITSPPVVTPAPAVATEPTAPSVSAPTPPPNETTPAVYRPTKNPTSSIAPAILSLSSPPYSYPTTAHGAVRRTSATNIPVTFVKSLKHLALPVAEGASILAILAIAIWFIL
jgi:hypothetical protein